jgi:predicted regulator of Ras-like GTPase activity (Roadblock/LC7/MglB family)
MQVNSLFMGESTGLARGLRYVKPSMNNNLTAPYIPSSDVVQQIMKAPQVVGYVQCSDSGDVLVQEGNEVDALANVLAYFHQVAGLVGESFGLEGLEEAQIQGKAMTVVCLPHQGGAAGILLNSRTRLGESVSAVRQVLAAA